VSVPAAVLGVARELIEAIRHAEPRRRGGAGAGVSVSDLVPSGSTFLRGHTMGALVGAAIAGSTIWQHRHQRRQARDAAMASGPDASPAQVAGDSTPR
jgi:hypothetical protein